MIANSGYTVGGTVQAGGGIYISRRTDDELLQLCLNQTFAYILTPRQMGKSSLMVHTAQRLTDEGIRCVTIDLTQIGTQVTADAWYLGLLTIIEDHLMLDTDVFEWWQQHEHLGITQRLTRFVEEILLTEITASIVIFVDEIDTTLSLDYTDDFFIAIRYFYVNRSQNPSLKRLSFVLIGVATPGDLIRDPQRTPFNIGQRIDLTDFTVEEALPLAEELGLDSEKNRSILSWVLDWTAGHPYLTQRLFADISRDLKEGKGTTFWTRSNVDKIVRRNFFGVKSEQDNNLQFVRDMLTKQVPDGYKLDILTTYREVCYRRKGIKDEEQSVVKSHLKLSGIVKKNGAFLKVRNRIYQTVFGRKWIYEHLSINWLKTIKTTASLGAAIFIVLLIPFSIYAEQQRRIAQEQRQEAIKQREIAQEQRQEAIRQREIAEQQREIAEQQQQIAEQQQQIAEQQQQIVEDLFLGQLAKTAKQDLSPKVKALLDTIAWSVKIQRLPSAYNRKLDGKEFESFSDHPREKSCIDNYFGQDSICGEAAGRYHIIPKTWDRLAIRLSLSDFSPTSQDLAAIELLREKGSLAHIENGNFQAAIHNVSVHWVTLPNSEGKSHYESRGYQARSIDDLEFMYNLFYARYLGLEEN